MTSQFELKELADVGKRSLSEVSEFTVTGNDLEKKDEFSTTQVVLSGNSLSDASSSIKNFEKQEAQVVTELDDEDDFPDGGVRAWMVVLGSFFGLIACFGLLNTIGVIETYIQDNQLSNENSSVIGWVFSLFLFMCFSSCIFSGTYFDRNGFRDPIIFGGICQVAGLIGAANATEIWHFILSLSILAGVGNGVMMAPLVGIPSHYFLKKRGTATGLATVGGSVGGAIFPIILRKLFKVQKDQDPNFGFQWGVRCMALINLVLLILSVILAKERIKAPIVESKEGTSKWKSFFRTYVLECFDAKAFLDKRYLFIVIGTVFAEISLNSAVTYFGSYCTHINISESDAFTLIMVLNLCGIPGRYIPGYLSDIVGKFNVSIATLTMLTIVMLVGWLPFGNSLTAMYVISALYGFCSGSIYSLLPVCIGQISKVEEFGRRYSTLYFVVAFGTLAGVPITGAIISNESKADYQHYVLFCGIMALAGAICFVISRQFTVTKSQKI